MFDSVESLRAMARRYRKAADSSQDRDGVNFFVALAVRCERQAEALETKQQEHGAHLVAWDSFHSPAAFRLIDRPS